MKDSALNIQNRAHFAKPDEMSPRSGMLRSKLTKMYISQRNINGSAPNLQNRARFSKPVEMSPRSGMLWLKLTKT